MKTLLLGSILTIASFSAIASSCPDIDGIFACTGLNKTDSGNVVSVTSKITADGRGQILFNRDVYLEEGKEGVFCNSDSYKDEGRQVIKRGNDLFTKLYRIKNAAGKIVTYQSACVRIDKR